MTFTVKEFVDQWDGPYPVAETLNRLNKDLNGPFFEHGSQGTTALRAVRRCWVDLQVLPYFGPAGKTFYLALMDLADKWQSLADSTLVDDAERALFLYNRALLDSAVLEAVTQSKGT